MTDIEALRARMREAAEKAMAATSDNWFHGEYSDVEYAPPAGDENGAHWFPLADELAPAVCDYLIAAQPSATIALDAEITRLREERDKVTRERDEARKQVNGLRLSQSLDKDSAYVIRELLNRHNVPAAAFVDDHVANAIAQRDAAEAALSAAQEDVEGLKKQVTSTALDALAADGQAHESYAAAMALHERLTAILDWCDLAADQPSTFNQQGVKLLQGPVFDDARKAVADHAIYAPKEPTDG